MIKQNRPAVTNSQHAYYRGVIVPAMARYCGYESNEECHHAIKAAFFGRDPRESLPSMANMPREEASRLIDYAIRRAAEFGLVLPDPMGVSEADADALIEAQRRNR